MIDHEKIKHKRDDKNTRIMLINKAMLKNTIANISFVS